MAYRILAPTVRLQKCIITPALRKPSNNYSNFAANQSSSATEGVLKKKLNQLVQWYEETTGMDEVRMAQKRVLDAEERFINAQDRRRESNKEVAAIQNKLKELYAELDNTTRGEERYVALITEEHKLLKHEKLVTSEFKHYEREEREHFSALSSAVKESHEKERAQAERTKYWSIIGSIIGTFIGIAGSSVNNEMRMRELRRLLIESASGQKTGDIFTSDPMVLSRHEKELNAIASEINASLRHNGDVVNRLNDVITVLDNKVILNQKSEAESVRSALSQQQIVLETNLREMKAILATRTVGDPLNSGNETISHSFREYTEDKNETVKLLFLSSIVVVFPIVFRYFGLFS